MYSLQGQALIKNQRLSRGNKWGGKVKTTTLGAEEKMRDARAK